MNYLRIIPILELLLPVMRFAHIFPVVMNKYFVVYLYESSKLSRAFQKKFFRSTQCIMQIN